MNKNKYIFDKTTLSFKRNNRRTKIKRFIVIFTSSLILSFIMFSFADKLHESPKEKKLKKDVVLLQHELHQLNSKIENLDKIMLNIQERDENIYRVIFETNPIPEEIRKAGFGGSKKYLEMSKYENYDVIIELNKALAASGLPVN